MAQLIGGKKILWASDVPHEPEWHEFSGDIDTLVAREDLAEGLVRQILFENFCRLYNLAAERFTVATGDGFLKSASSLV